MRDRGESKTRKKKHLGELWSLITRKREASPNVQTTQPAEAGGPRSNTNVGQVCQRIKLTLKKKKSEAVLNWPYCSDGKRKDWDKHNPLKHCFKNTTGSCLWLLAKLIFYKSPAKWKNGSPYKRMLWQTSEKDSQGSKCPMDNAFTMRSTDWKMGHLSRVQSQNQHSDACVLFPTWRTLQTFPKAQVPLVCISTCKE